MQPLDIHGLPDGSDGGALVREAITYLESDAFLREVREDLTANSWKGWRPLWDLRRRRIVFVGLGADGSPIGTSIAFRHHSREWANWVSGRMAERAEAFIDGKVESRDKAWLEEAAKRIDRLENEAEMAESSGDEETAERLGSELIRLRGDRAVVEMRYDDYPPGYGEIICRFSPGSGSGMKLPWWQRIPEWVWYVARMTGWGTLASVPVAYLLEGIFPRRSQAG